MADEVSSERGGASSPCLKAGDSALALVEPGERKTVTLSIARDALAYYDDLAHMWVAEAGEFEVLVGASSQDIRASARFALTDSSRWL